MSEHNIIRDSDGKIIGNFRHGVAWTKSPRKRLGEYDAYSDQGFVYDNNREKVAQFDDGRVTTLAGEELGRYSGGQLMVNDEVVGKFNGEAGVAAAAIAFVFNSPP